ncbi:Carboxylesterase A precursor [Nocardioides dokdonensis FR1436]|uniref:Carboxylesterase A n=1 Tax=Nocardioides dokdonensis FR1436 TaxID=1300347 RepID=A0A1A9GI71_9ACTN|nr:alpha/beta hydrolase [Nocardioides dokdonensis]ANH38019.1 Carboxylesterase A precursor [Nocardioides dokdonensis FR1436]
MKRAVAIVVVFAMVLSVLGLALALVLGGVLGSDGQSGRPQRDGPAPTTTPSGDATEPPDPALAGFYSQTLDWQPCESGPENECARLEVPLDYAAPDAETIEIAVLRVPAAEPEQRLGSLVVNPGGPGAPGTSYAAAGDGVFRAPLLARYDIVGFDPRGTGASAPVDCLSDEELTRFLAADPAPDEPAEVTALVEDLEDFFAGCAELSGDLAAHVSTVEAARDMDVLRAALGETGLTYLGASYGTKLGATYADLFPDRADRLVLDGAVDVSLTGRGLNLGQAAGFERALRAYVGDCVENTDDCFLGDTVQEGLDRITAFLDDVDEEPIPAGRRELTAGSAFYGLITPLYVSDYWFLLSQGLETAFEGDGTTLMLLADTYASRTPSGEYADNSAEAIYAINCLDDPSSTPVEDIPAQVPDFLEVSPTLGEVFAWSLVGCAGFQSAPDALDGPTGEEITAAGAEPILVVGTTRDPATPYEWAEALAAQLEPGVLLTRDGDGHTAYNSGNACIDTAIEDFLIDGTVPDDGTTC